MPTRPSKSLLPLSGLIAASCLAAILSGILLASPARADHPPGAIDYDGFLRLSTEVAPYRKARLVDLAAFNQMKGDADTLIIDARSEANFLAGHIEGAVNLEFSDFTDEKLAEVIGRKDRRILIYCNNNFTDDIVPVMLKRAPLALNVPTFINLYGYGYTNIYELSGDYSIADPAIGWIGRTVQEN